VGLLKDASKVVVKAAIDTIEREAWYDYFAADVVSRAYFPLWQLATNNYWEAYEGYQSLLAQKAKLIEGYDPATGTRIVLNKPFSSSAALEIFLDVVQPPGSPPVQLHVLVGGQTASPAGRNKYRLSAADIATSGGVVTLEVH
jgi:hypothetical protein